VTTENRRFPSITRPAKRPLTMCGEGLLARKMGLGRKVRELKGHLAAAQKSLAESEAINFREALK
jgi:hypothetical protein